ncbi:MAG: bifunctional aminoglycoside phosphotransferase/ATP-binding protein [Frankiaceae bacterium]
MRPARLVETHASVLVFLADHVYKMKKAQDLGFADFRSLEARRAACHEEVELNQRLAPDVYLGVCEVTGPDGQPCDAMVAMRRLPDNRRLARLVRRGQPVDDHLRQLARKIAAFHTSCQPTAATAAAGETPALRGLWRSGLAALHRFAPTVLSGQDIADLERDAFRYLAGREDLFRQRQDRGYVRDGHGDLLAEDIFCLDDGPRVLDCLEFDPLLRYGDVLADVAFLAMDLERLGRPDLARRFLDWYQEFSGVSWPQSLEHYYIAYRAFVRCKVACLRWQQGDEGAAVEARELCALAGRHLRRASVRLVLIGGLPGSGKSTLAQALVASVPDWALLRSDVVRREFLAEPPGPHREHPVDKGPYTPKARAAVYRGMYRRARSLLFQGTSVVIDASWTSAVQRGEAVRLAAETTADLVELHCQVPPTVAAERIARRAAEAADAPEAADASEAGSPAYAALAASQDPWPTAVTVPTNGLFAEALDVAEGACGIEKRRDGGGPGRGRRARRR